jgi:hypothetical protein
MRVSTLNDLTVELKHQAQYAMCSRVLRAKVQGVILDFSHD